MSLTLPGRSPKDPKLIVGGTPRAELLPPELKQEERARGTRRALGGLVIVVVIVVGAAYVLSAVVAEASAQRLAAANASSAQLLAEQGKYIEVRQLAAQVKASEDARKIGMATDVDWMGYLSEIDARVRAAGATVTSFQVTASTPLSPLPEGLVALEGPRQLELKYIGSSTTYPILADWLDSFEELDGFVDLNINSIKLEAGVYTFDMSLHVDERAFSYLYVDDPTAEATAETAETTEEVNQ